MQEAGYNIVINESKPRKGSFVVTVKGEETPIIELLDMARPFKKLRELDIDAILAEFIGIV